MLDFFDLDLFARGTPYAELARLRRETPVAWCKLPASMFPEQDHEEGFWLVTRHRDICAISKDPTTFYSGGGTVLADAPPPTSPPSLLMVRNGFAHLDPPRHTEARRLIAPHFAPRAITALEERIRHRARLVVDRAATMGELDFVKEVAVPFPTSIVFEELLGFDERDAERATFWGDLFVRVHAVPPHDREFDEVREKALFALDDMHECALRILHERRARPREDLFSVLAHMKTPEGEPMTEEMFTSYFWSLVTGAFDTTASTIAGGVLALHEVPGERERLYADRTLVTSAVEEMLRWVTPVVYFRRTVAVDTEVGGVAMKAGQRVAMCWAAANRDEEVFAEPDRFDISRTPNDHMAFGYGPHFCLGARLARVTVRMLFDELLDRGIVVDVLGPVVRARSNFVNRIVGMPVAFRSESGELTLEI